MSVVHTSRLGIKALLAAAVAVLPLRLLAQAPPPHRPAAGHRPAAKNQRPSWAGDLAGYWVSLVTNDWRYRMVTPAKGDVVGIPVTRAAVNVAEAWDPARDTADGLQCRSYGAGEIMMRPERVHITWRGSRTLVMQIDAGMQTRVFNFGGGAPPDIKPSWQGYSSAAWVPRATPGFGFRRSGGPPRDSDYLHVITSHMRPGYLRSNGVPYSVNAVLTENFDVVRVPGHEMYLVDTSTVTDPKYLEYPFTLTSIFLKQPGDAGWDPTPCSSTW